jgi:hypothetical protein
MLNAIRDTIDGGAGAGVCRIYSGTRPATSGAETTILAELTLSDPSAPNASAGVLTFSAITQDSSANNTGTATWFRVLTSGGTPVFDGLTTATTGTAGDLNLNTLAITTGVAVQISSFTITAGNP